MSGKPLWRQVVDGLDRAVAPALDSVIRRSGFAQVAKHVVGTRRAVQRQIESQTRHVLHAVNLPAATDIRRLQVQLTSLEADMRRLAQDVDDVLRPQDVDQDQDDNDVLRRQD